MSFSGQLNREALSESRLPAPGRRRHNKEGVLTALNCGVQSSLENVANFPVSIESCRDVLPRWWTAEKK